jgi:hypothetical protein
LLEGRSTCPLLEHAKYTLPSPAPNPNSTAVKTFKEGYQEQFATICHFSVFLTEILAHFSIFASDLQFSEWNY